MATFDKECEKAVLVDLAVALHVPDVEFTVLSVVAGSIVITASASVPVCAAIFSVYWTLSLTLALPLA